MVVADGNTAGRKESIQVLSLSEYTVQSFFGAVFSDQVEYAKKYRAKGFDCYSRV